MFTYSVSCVASWTMFCQQHPLRSATFKRIDATLGSSRDRDLVPEAWIYTSSFLFLVVRSGAPSSVLAPSSDALCS